MEPGTKPKIMHKKTDERRLLGGNSAGQLKALVTRIQRLDEEIGNLNADKGEIYSEAKACGFDKGVLRKVVTRLKKEKQEVEEEDALVELYENIIRGVSAVIKEQGDDFNPLID